MKKKYIDYYQSLKWGYCYLNKLEYLRAKSEFSNALSCENVPKFYREKIHFYRAITNYRLKEKTFDLEIIFDENNSESKLGFQMIFLRTLRLDKLGMYELALEYIEENIISDYKYQKEFNELIIHLSEETQLFCKMLFN